MSTELGDLDALVVKLATVSSLVTNLDATLTTVSAATATLNTTLSALNAKSGLVSSRSDTFTGTGNGTAVDVSTTPYQAFAIQVTQTGVLTSWNLVLEGSLDGVTYSTILTHVSGVQTIGSSVFSTANTPVKYFRSRCVALVIGLGTSVTASILGMQ